MKYLNFLFYEKSDSGKTNIYAVVPIDSEGLNRKIGWITWYSYWRKYVFHPDNNTVYDPNCLREIADFTEQKTREHKENVKSKA